MEDRRIGRGGARHSTALVVDKHPHHGGVSAVSQKRAGLVYSEGWTENLNVPGTSVNNRRSRIGFRRSDLRDAGTPPLTIRAQCPGGTPAGTRNM